MFTKTIVSIYLAACAFSKVDAFVTQVAFGGKHHDLSLGATKHPLIVAGESLLEDDNEQMDTAARALIQAGTFWTSDWTEVTFACADAAKAFRNVGHAEIGGCTSIGPPCSVPNLIEIQYNFSELAKTTGNGAFKICARAFGDLAIEYDGNG